MFLTIGGLKRLSQYMGGQLKSAIAVTGGTINGAVIGGTTPAAGTFTSLTGTSGAISGNTLAVSNIFSGSKRVTTQVDVTSSTTLVPITGLSVALAAGGTYAVEAYIPCTCNASGGVKVALATSDTLTATSINYTATLSTASASATVTTTTLGTGLGSTAAVINAYIDGVIVVNAAGTLVVQIAQNASNGAATSAYVNGFLKVTRIA